MQRRGVGQGLGASAVVGQDPRRLIPIGELDGWPAIRADRLWSARQRSRLMAIDWRKIVTEGAGMKASDVFFKVGSPPATRIRGTISILDEYPVLSEDDTQSIAYELMSERQRALFEDYPERDIGLTLGDICRLRINIYRERGNVGIVMRIIPLEILTIDELQLPEILKEVVMHRQGLVLVTGPTGCGKSTTLAGMINHVNEFRHCNIVTIEDPIEYVHRDKESIVNQREIGIDTESFTDALKFVVRQSPDVILIGEMRDVETMGVAMQAAETGHLVFATVHTRSASETMERIINMFPPHDKPQICMRLSTTLRSVISQVLVPRIDETGRLAALEIMVVTPTIAKMIEDGATGEVYGAIDDGGFWGMQTMNQALVKHYQAARIGEEECTHYAGNSTEMRQMLRRAEVGGPAFDRMEKYSVVDEATAQREERERAARQAGVPQAPPGQYPQQAPPGQYPQQAPPGQYPQQAPVAPGQPVGYAQAPPAHPQAAPPAYPQAAPAYPQAPAPAYPQAGAPPPPAPGRIAPPPPPGAPQAPGS
jgi:twitching motility protein PilT